MKLFALAIRSERNVRGVNGGTEIKTASMATLAKSIQEARGIGLEAAKETWPPREGWQDHSVSAVEIPDWMVKAASQ